MWRLEGPAKPASNRERPGHTGDKLLPCALAPSFSLLLSLFLSWKFQAVRPAGQTSKGFVTSD